MSFPGIFLFYCILLYFSSTLWGKKKLHPFYFLNDFVKSCSIFIIFGTQIPEWMTNLSTSPNECHCTTLWNTTYVNLFITTVMQALNVMTNWHLRTNTSHKCSKCLPLVLTHALRRFRHWLIAWSVMLCWIPNHAKIISSGTLAECLVWYTRV